MIQIYSPGNTEYDQNGNMTLMPESADVHVKLNDTWEAEMTHPIDPEGRWRYIENDAVVKMPSFNGEQLFRIKDSQKSDSGITAMMEPVFMDAMDDCFLVDVRPTDKNGQQALDIMTAPNSRYSGQSDITKTSTAYYEYKNLIEALNGDDENSFVNRWGGEILFDNFTVIVNGRVGGDYGYQILYGKNIPQNGIQEETDIRDVVTRIYPKGYNGHTITDNGYVDSPLINSYPLIRCATMTFEDVKMAEDASEDEEDGVIICSTQEELDAALAQKCQEQYSQGLDKPKVSISVDLVMLKNTEQYKKYQILETVSLGDTVHCVHSRLGINTSARIIELEYDSILQKVSSVVIGDYEYNYFDNVSSAVNRIDTAIRPDGTLVADRIQGFINGVYAQLRLQNTVAQKQDVRAVLFEDLDPDSPLYGAMALGTQGLQISITRTADGRDWDWTTALTARGLVADIIIAGLLADKTGRSWWNLDTGDLQLSGKFEQRDTNGNLSVAMSDNQLRLYSWLRSGAYAGAVGALALDSDNTKQGVGLWCDKGKSIMLGCATTQGSGQNLKAVINFDDSSDAVPRIINTASGKMFPDNPSGGITVENGLIRSWGLRLADGTISAITGLSWNSSGITRIERANITVINGLITSVTTATENY